MPPERESPVPPERECPVALRETFLREIKTLQADHAAEIESVRREGAQRVEQLTEECERLLEELRAADDAVAAAAAVGGRPAGGTARNGGLRAPEERRRSSVLSGGSEMERHVLEAMIDQLECELGEREQELAATATSASGGGEDYRRQLAAARDRASFSRVRAEQLAERLSDREVEFEDHVTMLKRQISVHSDAASGRWRPLLGGVAEAPSPPLTVAGRFCGAWFSARRRIDCTGWFCTDCTTRRSTRVICCAVVGVSYADAGCGLSLSYVAMLSTGNSYHWRCSARFLRFCECGKNFRKIYGMQWNLST